MAILLIRHGETDFNADRIIQFPETPLGERGREQADRLGIHLAARPIELVLTSDYRRARMTAGRIAQHAGTDVAASPHLRERNFGDVRGTPYSELGAIDIFALDYVPPGGESWATFDARVDVAWDEVTARARILAGDLAVVTHGLVLRSLIERVLDASAHVPGPELVVANTSVTIVEHDPPWRVIALANMDHLTDVGIDGAAV